MNCLRLTTLACALTAALALSACNKTGDGTTTPSGTTGTGSMSTSPPASAASR